MIKKDKNQASLNPKTYQLSVAFGRILKSSYFILRKFSQKIRQLLNQSSGISAVIIIATIPLLVYGVNYLIEYTKKTDVEISDFEIPYVIGKNIAKIFNPGKTWSEQEDYLYSVAAQTYNDESFDSSKTMLFSSEGVIKAAGITETLTNQGLFKLYTDFNTDGRQSNLINFIENEKMFVDRPPFENFIYNESNNSVSYIKYVKIGSGMAAYSVSKYKKNESLLKLTLTSSGTIQVDCPKLKKSAEVTLPRNDIDIILAIPTNQASNTTSNDHTDDFEDYSNKMTADATPIKQIAKACQVFLIPFLHSAGVAVGIVPYSGKVSLSPYEDEERVIETPLNYNPTEGLTYAVQAMFYGSDGKKGGDVVLHEGADASLSYGDYLNWGGESYGRPIMARRGRQILYRNVYLNSGAITDLVGSKSLLLDMTTPPTSSDDYKFMQMNTNPCYLGFCNTLAMVCERDCPTYKANPYFIKELTSDVQGLIYDLELFLPFKDEHNKSNFLFLPIVMAGNLFSWGSHPSELSGTGRVKETERNNKKRVVVVIANAPDNFEPQEMTYLGFNNDFSEIPMIESDTILFNKDRGYLYEDGKYKGAKGAVSFESQYGGIEEEKEGGEAGERGGYVFQENEAPNVTARISFPNKAMLRIVTERVIPSTVEVYNDNGIADNVDTFAFWGGTKTLNFQGPQQIPDFTDLNTKFQQGNYTTKGPNFGHNLSTKKLKINFSKCKLTRAFLKNQILRFYGVYDSSEIGKPMIPNTSGSVWSGMPIEMKERIDPCIDCYKNYNSSETQTTGWIFQPTSKYSTSICGQRVSFQGDCFNKLKWKEISTNVGFQYLIDGTETDCKAYSHFEDQACSAPCSTVSSGYFIGAYNFSPICYGIGSLSKFVCAVDHFQNMDPAVIPDVAKINAGGSLENLGAIFYNTEQYDGTRYRCYNTNSTAIIGEKREKTCKRCENKSQFFEDSNCGMVCGDLDNNGGYDCRSGYIIPYSVCQDYDCSYIIPSDSSYIEISMGKFGIKNYYYYKLFATEKQRKRTITETIDTYRDFPTVRTGDPGTYPNTPCCSEVWDDDPCGKKEKGCLIKSFECEEVCTRYGGCRHQKTFGVFRGYWCGLKKKSYTEERDGQTGAFRRRFGDTGSYLCTSTSLCEKTENGTTVVTTCTQNCENESGDDMDENDGAGGHFECTTLCKTNGLCVREGDVCVKTRYNTGSHNTDTSCSGVCWQHHMNVPTGWSRSGSKSVECTPSQYSPRTKYRATYSRTQQQNSISCTYSDGENNNSKCEYAEIEEPYVQNPTFGYIKYNCSSSNCSTCLSQDTGGFARTGVDWTETAIQSKMLGAFYQRKPDGTYETPYYEICDTNGMNCSHITPSSASLLTYSAGLRESGTNDMTKATESIYRYNLYNFFFISGDVSKLTEFTYDAHGKLTSTISSESDSNLLHNKGVYLLPTEEDDTYWVCFCGDADLELEFEDATDSSVKFSNIIPNNSAVSLDYNHEITETAGVEVNYIEKKKIFYISPDQIKDMDEDGNYYVDLEITGKTRILSIELTNRPFQNVTLAEGGNSIKAYAHPNIISDKLINTRIIDGYDQATYQNMKLYGNMNYNGRTDLPRVSLIHHLYYNSKDGTGEKYAYPQLNEGNALPGEEGDFFIQIWDYNDEAPVVKWKIGSSIQSSTDDISVENSGFGPFRSNYAFSGLHRMFFPYDIYNKDYTGYSEAKYSAQVFMGYTLPINLILASNGYQESFGVDSGYVSNYTRSNNALENLAKDACVKLKKDLSNAQGAPEVFLVKYRTSSTLSLESCADYNYSANSEEDLMKVMREISLLIEGNSGTNGLTVNSSDIVE